MTSYGDALRQALERTLVNDINDALIVPEGDKFFGTSNSSEESQHF
ncbi:uncharacterized protein G2W53_026215 [Senna tora]|uniref:Uncharacterized protein n=1 Tax=Senna tora TaxID=362788 RepID=A0A834WEW5_9FABA|nr:uncharacterized protein G2W53_026215 [Senna tora]